MELNPSVNKASSDGQDHGLVIHLTSPLTSSCMKIMVENAEKEIVAFNYPEQGNDRHHQQTLQAKNGNQSVNIRPALKRVLFSSLLDRLPMLGHLYIRTNKVMKGGQEESGLRKLTIRAD